MPRKPTPEVENRIIQAATEIILSNGIVGLRVRDVAQASGTTVAMVYRRFIDRDGLLDAAVANFYDARIESLIDIAEDLARRPTPITIDDVVDAIPPPDYPGSKEEQSLMARVPALASENDIFRRRIQAIIERQLPRFQDAVQRFIARLPHDQQFDYRIITILLLNQSWVFNDLRGTQRVGNDEYREFLRQLLTTSQPAT